MQKQLDGLGLKIKKGMIRMLLSFNLIQDMLKQIYPGEKMQKQEEAKMELG